MSFLENPRVEFTLSLPEIWNFKLQYYYQDSENVCSPRNFPPHVNDKIEAYVLFAGDVSFMVENTLYKLTAGDVVLTRPNEVHNCILNSVSVHKHACYWFDAEENFLFSPLINHGFGQNNLVSASPEQKKQMLKTLELLRSASLSGDKIAEFAYSVEFVRYINEHSGEKTVAITLPEELQIVLDEINQNFATITSIEELCSKRFISHSMLCRLFQKYLHTTPRAYLETKRLAHSRILLQRGKSVLDACVESGFSDCSNYIRFFKKRFGVTPHKYKG